MPLPLLEGLLVVEISRSTAAAFTGRLLADLGAEVIAIEPPGGAASGDPREMRVEAYLKANKRRATLDLSQPGALESIRERAAIILYDGSLPDDAVLLDESAVGRCVVTVVTPWGLESPYRYLHGDELLLYALSGVASTTPEPDERSLLERPMQSPGHEAACVGGLVAATAALQAWFTAEHSGRGALLDVAYLDALASTLNAPVFNSVVEPGTTERFIGAVRGVLCCMDGHVYTQRGSWKAWAAAMGKPEWAEPPFDDARYCAAHLPELMARLEALLAERTASDVFRTVQAAGITAYPVHTIAQAIDHPHMIARDVFRPIVGSSDGTREVMAPQTPIGVQEGRGPVRTPDVLRAPGADTAYARARLLQDPPASRPAPDPGQRLPLEHVRVADFSWMTAGPHCTKWLAALGAEVIKVETRSRPDVSRAAPPFMDKDPAALEGSYGWNFLNYSKRSLTVNTATADGRAVARRLITSSDVVIENFSAGIAERMGIDFDALVQEKPDLVMVSSSGLGRVGPDSGMRSFGKSIHAFAGHTYLTSWPGTPPRGLSITWTDPTTGEMAAVAILAGLVYAKRTGRGLYYDLSMVETTMALMFEPYLEHFGAHEPEPAGNRVPNCAPHNTYQCTDGWIAITAHDDAEWGSLAPLIGCSSSLTLADRLAQQGDIDAAIDAWCATRGRAAALAELMTARVCAAPVLEMAEVGSSQHFQQRDLIRSLTKPGVGTYNVLKLPWVSHPDAGLNYVAAPLIGQDNDYVLKDVLQLTADEIATLAGGGALT